MPSWDPRDQRHWLSALRRQDWVRDIRADGRANLLTVARLVALHAGWETLESRPTWAHLAGNRAAVQGCEPPSWLRPVDPVDDEIRRQASRHGLPIIITDGNRSIGQLADQIAHLFQLEPAAPE